MFVLPVITSFACAFRFHGTIERFTFTYDGGRVGSAVVYGRPAGAPRRPGPAPVVVFFHGLNSIKDYDTRVLLLCHLGFEVVGVDLPGHGESPEALGAGFWRVSLGVLDHLTSRPARWNASAIGLLGHSFGGLVALKALMEDPRPVAGVLWAPVTNLSQLRWLARAPEFAGKWAPLDSPVNSLGPETLPRNALVLHGTGDSVVNVTQTRSFAAKVTELDPANVSGLRVVEVEEGDHALLDDSALELTAEWLVEFVAPWLAPVALDSGAHVALFAWFNVTDALFVPGFFACVALAWRGKAWSGDVERTHAPGDERTAKGRVAFFSAAAVASLVVLGSLSGSLPWNWRAASLVASLGALGVFARLVDRRCPLHPSRGQREVGRTQVARDAATGLAFGASDVFATSVVRWWLPFSYTAPASPGRLASSLLVSFAAAGCLDLFFRDALQAPARFVLDGANGKARNHYVVAPVALLAWHFADRVAQPVVRLVPLSAFYASALSVVAINALLVAKGASRAVTLAFGSFVMGWMLAGCPLALP
ncbi:MAG: hypothetical protein Kow0069_17440 [Promethearchaeota archaeon]